MADLARLGAKTSWGPAEQAAVDRCLSVPGLSEPNAILNPRIRLSRTIESEIIPRLMLAHLADAADQREATVTRVTSADVRDLARLVLVQGGEAVISYVAGVRARGHDLETVFLDLFAPTARFLGDLWKDDLCNFADVTIGMSRLQAALRELSREFEASAAADLHGRILLAAVPGEQHRFGVSMLETFFRRAGWEVCGGDARSRADLIELAREDWLDAIGISLSSDVLYPLMRPLIVALRKASRNPSLLVMVGGRYFMEHPDQAGDVGADAAASDAPDALRRAEEGLSFALARC